MMNTVKVVSTPNMTAAPRLRCRLLYTISNEISPSVKQKSAECDEIGTILSPYRHRLVRGLANEVTCAHSTDPDTRHAIFGEKEVENHEIHSGTTHLNCTKQEDFSPNAVTELNHQTWKQMPIRLLG